MLQDIFSGTLGTAAIDIGSSRSLFKCCCILANSDPPDVIQGIGAEAVDSFPVVGTDEDGWEDGAVFEYEDGVGISAFGLVIAGAYLWRVS